MVFIKIMASLMLFIVGVLFLDVVYFSLISVLILLLLNSIQKDISFRYRQRNNDRSIYYADEKH